MPDTNPSQSDLIAGGADRPMVETRTDPAAIRPVDAPGVSATDLAFATLYEAVISLKLPPGTKVSEVEMARQLDMSRQPIRDAFFRLSQLGFLAIRPQRATLITRISEQAIIDAVFTRTALEVECLRLVMARNDGVATAELRASMDAQRDALHLPDRAQSYALDEAFHELICTLSGHPHAWALIREQKAHMDRIRYLTLSEERRHRVLDEHGAIVEAVAKGDAAQAEARLRAHLSGVLTVVDQVRQSHPQYFEPSP